MSLTLNAEFRFEPTQNMMYWWPLVFEVMRRQALDFYHPDWESGAVHYLYLRKRTTETDRDMDSVTKPFKNLWDEIYSQSNEEILVTFWSKGRNKYTVSISMHTNSDNQVVRIDLDFEGVYVMHEPTSTIKKRLRRVSALADNLYELFKLCIGEMYWEYAGEAFAPWASFGALPDALSHNRAVHPGPERKLIPRKLPREDRVTGLDGIYFLNPVPVPLGNGKGWDFVSL